MHRALQALAGEVARVRAEVDFLIRKLDDLEGLSHHQPWISEAQDSEIESATYRFSRSAKDNLERTTSDVQTWHDVVSDLVAGATSHLPNPYTGRW